MTGNPEVEIENIEYDSRRIEPGGLFVAVKGFKVDGYNYVAQAVKKGAVAVMGERTECPESDNHISVPDVRQAMATAAAAFYGYPGQHLDITGVTGTNGKTTTCYLIKGIMETAGKPTGMVTSQVYNTGANEVVADRTTPESVDLQRYLHEMKGNRCVGAVVEVSSHALVLHRVDHVDFRAAVYTNLTRDHLDFHSTMEEYMQAKAMLAEKVSRDRGYVVINLDVPEFRALCEGFDCPVIGYSVSDTSADVYCDGVRIRPDRTEFRLVTPIGIGAVICKLPGRFNLGNAIAAAATGIAHRVPLESIIAGLQAARQVPGRFNYVGAGQPFAIYVDYAHTPDAIERLCESAREITRGRVLILCGCGGDRDKGKRPMMGKAATTSADFAVITSDNPRSEDPNAIIEDIKPGLVGESYEICMDRSEAIEKILKMAKPHDVVLLAGKGAENYQEVKGVRHHFSDTEQALKVLKELGYSNEGSERES
ncbi:MAG: UDP-N-acetylmuramoyl-L-alanyl-D-glutamate--2,6-diaminopimelate ligase [Candidatus Zixiibacteriota bacterium]|nr:MAG: UDP-N-acetylmuramoyl-L-alanyl-D-glutamate--2,6-diaminopimelate ligase [candidate division Zixibacteria bacterium]